MALNPIAIGGLIQDMRKDQGLTQAELAKKVRVSRKWIVELERGKPEAQLWKVLDVLEVLGHELAIRRRDHENT